MVTGGGSGLGAAMGRRFVGLGAELIICGRRLDVLVNNAAATFVAQTEQLSFRAADAILAPTLHGAMYCTLAAGKRWIEAGHKGVVLSILSTSTITGRAHLRSSGAEDLLAWTEAQWETQRMARSKDRA